MRGATQATAHHSGASEIQPYRQLVALQREIVAQARKNAEVEQECGALWQELVSRSNRRRHRPGLRRRLGAVGRAVLQRLGRWADRASGAVWCFLRPPADPTSV